MAVWAMVGCGATTPDRSTAAVPALHPSPIEALITADERHSYRLVLAAGHALTVLVDQHAADLAVTVAMPDGVAHVVDARAHGPESVTIVASHDATVDVTVTLVGGAVGPAPYTIRVAHLAHLATDDDHRRVRAERATTHARRLFVQPDAESRHEALEVLSQLSVEWRDLGDFAAEASTLSMVGDVHHANGALEDAELAYRQALVSSRQADDLRQTAELVNNLGVLDWRRARLSDATRHYEEALGLWRELQFAAGEAATLTNQGSLYFEAGEYQQALDRLLAAREIFQAERDVRGEAYVLNNLGVTSFGLGDLPAALDWLSQAVAKFRAADDVAGEGRAHLRLSRVHLARSDPLLAEASVNEALVLIRRAGDRFGEADALDLAGVAAAAAGDPQRALDLHDEARVHYRQIGGRRGEATTLHHAGLARLGLAEPARAQEAFAAALAIRREVGLRDAEADTLCAMGRTEQQRDQLERARATLDAALGLTEDVRGRVAGEYFRAGYLASRRACFTAQIDVLMQLHARTGKRAYAVQAFEASERERARSLLDTLEDVGTRHRLGVDPALLERERSLRDELNSRSYRLASLADRGGSSTQIAIARQGLAERVAEYRRLEPQVRAASRGYAALVSRPPLGLEDVRREVLDTDSALLRYSLGDERSYLWVVTTDTLRSVTLPGRATIASAAQLVHELVSVPPSLQGRHDDRSRQLRTALASLSELLLPPVVDHLLHHRRLLIVSEGPLQQVPFAALPLPGNEAALLSRHEVVMLPSATTLAVLRRMTRDREPAPRRLALLADPVYERDDPRLTPSAPVVLPAQLHAEVVPSLPLARLPFSGLEARWIASLLDPAEVLLASGLAASREVMTSAALRDFRIVHIAAHAVLDDEHPEVSGIALSLVDAEGMPQDGFIRLHEIQGSLQLRADLVVNSACDTARGRDMAGEGLLSLARGWFAAGVPRVVATTYGVPDAATAQFMREFYAAMLGPEPLTPAAALRAAQLRMQTGTEWMDPHFWSAFVLLGEPN